MPDIAEENFEEFGEIEEDAPIEETKELFERIKTNSITNLSNDLAKMNSPRLRTPPPPPKLEAPVVSSKTLSGLIDQTNAVKKLLASSHDPKIKQAVLKLSEAVSWMTSAGKK